MPSLVVVEPAMHHQPKDDDHPNATMFRGQTFLPRVYSAVTVNPAVRANTMFIIIYDERGGFQDRISPPIAYVFEAPRPSPPIREPSPAQSTTAGPQRPHPETQVIRRDQLVAQRHSVIDEGAWQDSPPADRNRG